MSKHTPGPWHVAPGDPQYVFAPTNAKSVAACSSKANARLIATAPELLDLARNVAGLDAHYLPEGKIISEAVREWQEQARAAIAKAEGTS